MNCLRDYLKCCRTLKRVRCNVAQVHPATHILCMDRTAEGLQLHSSCFKADKQVGGSSRFQIAPINGRRPVYATRIYKSSYMHVRLLPGSSCLGMLTGNFDGDNQDRAPCTDYSLAHRPHSIRVHIDAAHACMRIS